MIRSLFALMILALLAGCLVERVPQYSPRRTPTPDHLAATSREDCLGCHDISSKRKHSVKDDCFNCHKICRECRQ